MRALYPFAAILLLSGCFLPHPDEPAGGTAEPPPAAREFEAPPALATEEPELAFVPASESQKALVAAEAAGLATAMQ
jgi:hypothetical protein